MANMSFLPEDYLERRAQRRTNLISLGLFVVVTAAVVAAFYVTDRQRTDIRNLQAQVNAQFEDAAKRLEQLDDLDKRKDRMIHKARVTAALLERLPRSLILAEITNNMPPVVALTELNMETRALKSNRPAPTTILEAAKQAKADAAKKAAADAASAGPDIVPTEVLLQLVGVAPTDVDVAQFMAALKKRDVFADVSLAFSEQAEVDKVALRRFRIELRLNQELDLSKFTPTRVARDLKFDPMGDHMRLTPELPARPSAPAGPVVPAADRTPKPGRK